MTMQRNLSAVSQYECVVSEEVDRVRTYDLDAMKLRLIASVNVTDTKSRKLRKWTWLIYLQLRHLSQLSGIHQLHLRT